MEYILGALAVYKLLQVADLLLPKEPMTWVKVVAGIVASYAISFLVDIENMVLGGLVIATLAGACHAVLRCLTLMGDMAFRKSLK